MHDWREQLRALADDISAHVETDGNEGDSGGYRSGVDAMMDGWADTIRALAAMPLSPWECVAMLPLANFSLYFRYDAVWAAHAELPDYIFVTTTSLSRDHALRECLTRLCAGHAPAIPAAVREAVEAWGKEGGK